MYDLLQKVPPDFAETHLAGYAASPNPDIEVEKLTHFALGVFWKASVHSWRKNENENLIELGLFQLLWGHTIVSLGDPVEAVLSFAGGTGLRPTEKRL